MAKRSLQFGIQPPQGTRVAWGARAIFKPISRKPMIDILWDRQDAFGGKEDREALVEWIKERGLPLIEAAIDEKSSYSLSTSHEKFRLADSGYIIEASPQGSGGYLYIGAWHDERGFCPKVK